MRDGRLAFVDRYLDPGPGGKEPAAAHRMDVPLPPSTSPVPADFPDAIDRRLLNERKIDLLLVVPPGFQSDLSDRGKATLYLLTREKDETSRLVNLRVTTVINRWKRDLKDARLARQGLPIDFDELIRIHDPERSRPSGAQVEEGMFSLLVRIFPFILVMWSLAGALYPAVDVCAGEKERGTMETLLISPVSREEIVWGKFLTIWVFSARHRPAQPDQHGSHHLAVRRRPARLVLPADGAVLGRRAAVTAVGVLQRPVPSASGPTPAAPRKGSITSCPFSWSPCRSSSSPLAPGVELNPFYSMVPVTGVALAAAASDGGAPPTAACGCISSGPGPDGDL